MTKKLLLIGNGCGVLDRKLGSEVDNFDIVVRLGTFELNGFEQFVGTKTDYCITAHWKLNIDRLNFIKTFITFPVFNEYYDESKIEQIKQEICSQITPAQLNNIVGFMSRQEANYIIDSYKELGNIDLNLSLINPSLGYRALILTLLRFSDYEIYTYGFDFFKTGWYWKPSHNRDVKNRHPYSYERAIHSLLLKQNKIKSL